MSSQYFHWNEKTIADFSTKYITAMYEDGYVFTRINKGVMHQTRSFRIDLDKFNPTSENRRILKKVANLNISSSSIPYNNYSYEIGKLAKDFYTNKFGEGTMSAQKIKELLTDGNKTNFNSLLIFSEKTDTGPKILGYCIAFENDEIIHYSYPFYDLNNSIKDLGLGMILLAMQSAKNSRKKYFYLGSLQRPTDTYKIQFDGAEWFDGQKWRTNTEEVKRILKEIKL